MIVKDYLSMNMDLRAVFSTFLLSSAYLYSTLIYLYLRKRCYKRRWWVRPMNRTSSNLGFFNNQFKEAYKTDHEEFFNMTRMTPAQYDHLCHLVRPLLTKKSLRKPISVNERVAITLLFLAHSDSARSKSWDFRIGKSTVYKIIDETCNAIWQALHARYLPKPSQETWKKVPIVMVWANSNFGQSLESDIGDIPPPKLLPGTTTLLPCTLIGDEAFPLKSYLMRPYPRKSLISDSHRIFNYRLSRARRTIENAFGILVSRWRILRRSIQCKEETAHKIVLAVVVLHNYIMSSNEQKYCPPYFVDQESHGGIVTPGQWRNEELGSYIVRIGQVGSNRATYTASAQRDTLRKYFMTNIGAVDWQFDSALRGYNINIPS